MLMVCTRRIGTMADTRVMSPYSVRRSSFDAREPEVVESHQRPTHRDDAHDHQERHDARQRHPQRRHRQRPIAEDGPEQVAKEAAAQRVIGEVAAHQTVEQAGLPPRAEGGADDDHALVLDEAEQQQLSQVQMQKRGLGRKHGRGLGVRRGHSVRRVARRARGAS